MLTWRQIIRKRSKFLIAAVAAVFAGVLSIRIALLGDKTLSRLGHRVGQLEGAANYREPPKPEWLSENEALYMSYHQDGDRFEFTRINVDSRVSTPMTELNRSFANELNSFNFLGTRPPWHFAPGIVLSPSDKLMVIIPRDLIRTPTQARPYVYQVADAAASMNIAWKFPDLQNPYPPLWFKDGKRWVLPSYPGFPGSTMIAQVSNTREPNIARRIALRTGSSRSWIPVAMTEQDRLWGFAGAMNSVDISEWNVFDGAMSASTHVKLPGTGYATGAALSPDRSRVAWLIRYHVETPVSVVARWAHRGAKRSPLDNPFEHVGIWVSNLYGANMKEIGTEDLSNAWYTDSYLRWLPGGKKLAFHIGMDLYTIPVDQ